MRKTLLFMILAAAGLACAPSAMGQGYTDALLVSVNYNTDFPCGNAGSTPTAQIQTALKQAAKYGGGTVDLTCYQTAIALTSDIFSTISGPVLLYLPEHAVTVNANATIPSNFELCGGPGASIAAGGSFTLTNNATACFNGFTGGGGGTPGGSPGQLQFNNAGAFGGVVGSAVDPASGSTVLSGSSTGGNDAFFNVAYAASSGVGGAMIVSSDMTDDTGANLQATGLSGIANLHGSNATGTAWGLYASASADNTGGQPQELVGLFVESATNSATHPPGFRSGIHILDQNIGDHPAVTANAALLIDEQTGESAYSIVTQVGKIALVDQTDTGNGIIIDEAGDAAVLLGAQGAGAVSLVSGSGALNLESLGAVGIKINATGPDIGGTGTGPVVVTTAGDLTLTVDSLHINTLAGVSATGSACAITTITNGIITAATCTP